MPPLIANQPWMEKCIGRSIELSFSVDKAGKAFRFEVVTTTGNKQLDEMAKALVLQKTFPTMTDRQGRIAVYGYNHVFTVMPATTETNSGGTSGTSPAATP